MGAPKDVQQLVEEAIDMAVDSMLEEISLKVALEEDDMSTWQWTLRWCSSMLKICLSLICL